MIIIIILIIFAGVAYFIINSLQQTNTTTPNTTVSNTIITLPTTTTPFINPIPNFILIKGSLDSFYKANGMTDVIYNNIKSNVIWNNDINIITNPVDNDTNKLAAQFRFFAEFWLNKLNTNTGFTNVYDSSGNIGRYDFRRNETVYTGKFKGVDWNWNTIDYCFTTVNSKRKNTCLGGWMYNSSNDKCYRPLNSTSTCDDYNYQTMNKYTQQSDVNNWMNQCNVRNSQTCLYPPPSPSP